MGQTSTKHVASGLETHELLDHVCTAAEKLSGKCGKHSIEVFKQVTALRDLSKKWSSWQQQAEQLHGHQVLTVAAALQALNVQLEWCKRKFHQKHLVSIRTLTSRQQAAHVLKVLSAAEAALNNFSTAFRLAVLLSQEQNSTSSSGRCEQKQHALQQLQQLQEQHERLLQREQAEELQEWQQLQWASPAPDVNQHAEQQQQSAAGAHNNPVHTAQAAAEASCTEPTSQLPCEPAQPLHGSATASPAATNTAGAACDAATSTSAASNTAQTRYQAAAAAAATDLAGAGPADKHDAFDIAAAAPWEHSQDGWQDLMQRAWRGEVQAVLACAQELIHGGDYCLQDCVLAKKLLRTVVQQSSGTACLWLGQLSERGLGLPAPDYVDAAEWYGKGAEIGHLECAQALAFYYEHGLGITQDTQAAKEWYEFAAEGGLAAAQNNLGQLLLQSPNCSHADTAAAVHWLQAAAEQGSPTALYNLGVCYELGIAEGRPNLAAAEDSFRQAATGKAWLRLGMLYLQQRDSAAAREAFTAAAEAGNSEAILQLAKLQTGYAVLTGSMACSSQKQQRQQQQLPLLPFELVSTLGSSVGSAWRTGTVGPLAASSSKGSSGVSPASSSLHSSCSSLAAQATADATSQLYQHAAQAGLAEAQHVVGCTKWSKGCVVDAMQSWHAAAAQGYGPSLLCLAAVSEKGLQGVKQDADAARACYAMAAARGCKEAAAHMALLDQIAALRTNLHTLQAVW